MDSFPPSVSGLLLSDGKQLIEGCFEACALIIRNLSEFVLELVVRFPFGGTFKFGEEHRIKVLLLLVLLK